MIQGAPINVLDYGAYNDGTNATATTAAFQAAIAAGSNIYVPSGTYLLNPVNLKDNLRISGDGLSSLLKANTTTGIFCNNVTGLGAAMTYVEIANLGFFGAGSKAIYQSDVTAYSSWFWIHDNFFDKNLAECIKLNMIESQWIEGNKFGHAGVSGATHRHIYITGQTTAAANQVFISNNHFQTSYGTESVRVEKGSGYVFNANTWEGNYNTDSCVVMLGVQQIDFGPANWFEGNYGLRAITLGKSSDGTADCNTVQIHNCSFFPLTAAPYSNESIVYISNTPDLRLDFFYNSGGNNVYLVKDSSANTDYNTGVLRDVYSNYYTEYSLLQRVGQGTIYKDWVINGSMEANSGWVAVGAVTSQGRSSAQAHAGTYSWSFVVNGANQGIRNDSFFAEPLVKGQIYTLNFWVYPASTTTVSASVSTFGTSQYNLNVAVTGLTQNAWNNVVLTFEALFDQGNPIVIFNSGAEVAGTWYIDDVFFKQILTPQTGTAYANNAAALAASVPINGQFTISNVVNRVFYP
jgi:hypothetical protein